MRTLLRFLEKYSNLLLFLLLEVLAINFMARSNHFQRSKIVGLNRQISGYIYGKVDGTREYLSLREANQKLVVENVVLRNRIDQLELVLDSSIVTFSYSEPYHFYFIPGRVIRNSVYKQYNYITLDKGKDHGVFKDMGVICSEGLVGIVLESSRNFSTVIPVINRDFRLSVKLKSNNYAGILQWEGGSPRHAVLNEIPFHVNLTLGDTIVTSGFSSIFPEGMMVGILESYLPEKGNFYVIRVKLSTDFQSLFHVNIIRNYTKEEQLILEEGIME
jgi:rod shape-determining protein MreC